MRTLGAPASRRPNEPKNGSLNAQSAEDRGARQQEMKPASGAPVWWHLRGAPKIVFASALSASSAFLAKRLAGAQKRRPVRGALKLTTLEVPKHPGLVRT